MQTLEQETLNKILAKLDKIDKRIGNLEYYCLTSVNSIYRLMNVAMDSSMSDIERESFIDSLMQEGVDREFMFYETAKILDGVFSTPEFSGPQGLKPH